MTIIKTKHLTEKQRLEIEELLLSCQTCSAETLFFPIEDGDLFYLLFTKEGTLGCAAALTLFSDISEPGSDSEENSSDSSRDEDIKTYRDMENTDYAECTAFTRPSLRHMGYFSSVFEILSQEIEDIDLYFPVSRPDKATLAALASLEAVHDRDEYKMEFSIGRDKKETFQPEAERLTPVWSTEEDGSLLLQFYLKESNQTQRGPAGSCRLAVSGDSACFYAFEIKESLRGQGLGRDALLLTLSLLSENQPVSGCQKLFLHVSQLNEAAVSLYKKTGFHISEILSYYLY